MRSVGIEPFQRLVHGIPGPTGFEPKATRVSLGGCWFGPRVSRGQEELNRQIHISHRLETAGFEPFEGIPTPFPTAGNAGVWKMRSW